MPQKKNFQTEISPTKTQQLKAFQQQAPQQEI